MFTSLRSLSTPRCYLLTAALLAASAHAQVYRSTGVDGRVTFSDRPLNSATTTQGNMVTPAHADESSPSAQLPYELRQSASRYPVTLYTTQECLPCDEARNFFKMHGVPFNERTIETPSDLDALKKLSNQENLPFATIGSQHLKGFSQDSWSSYLKAAGYPAHSKLPSNYRAPQPQPLTKPEPSKGAPPSRPAVPSPNTSPTPSSTPLPGAPTADNPAGLRF